MASDEKAVLVITAQAVLTDAGRASLGDPGVLTLIDRLRDLRTATVTIAGGSVRVELRDATDKPVFSYELGQPVGYERQGRWLDHEHGTGSTLRIPADKAAQVSWLLPAEGRREIRIGLIGGTVLLATDPNELRITVAEARTFWGDLFWVRSHNGDASYWQRLADFGIPQQVRLENETTGHTLVEMSFAATRRATSDSVDLSGFLFLEPKPLIGSIPSQLTPNQTPMFRNLSATGEHIGWIVSPTIINEIQQVVNDIFAACGEFGEHPPQGGLVIDWYDRAAKAFDPNTLNAFTRVRELLKSIIAMYVLPSSINNGIVAPEIETVWGQWFKDIFADESIPPEKRWCTFLKALRQPTPEFSQKLDNITYQGEVLREFVNTILKNRYSVLVIPPVPQVKWSCWAVDCTADHFSMTVHPGATVIKDMKVADQGLCLYLAIERVTVDFEFSVEPAGSTGNVALCIFSLGFANVVETQFGNGTATVDDALLSINLVPTQVGAEIKLVAKPGNASHANLEYFLQSFNVATFGLSTLFSFIATLANAWEGKILEKVGNALGGIISDLDLNLPGLFHFDDAPSPVVDKPVVVSNPPGALLVGASLILSDRRAPTPPPAPAMPTCSGDFAITLATDYLNAVLAHRFMEDGAPQPSFDWKQYMTGSDLPSVTLPEGYTPIGDWEETKEEWTIGPPIFEPAGLQTSPALNDPIGTIRIPFVYRLTRTHYTWRLYVQLAKAQVLPDFGIPVAGDKVLVKIDDILTIQYGMYRQADGKVVSPAPSLADAVAPRVNPSPGAHALDLGVGGSGRVWYPVPIATDEHINVQLEATFPAHLNMHDSTTFLPTLDLTYGQLQVSVTKASYSPTCEKLQNKPDLFSGLVEAYLDPYAVRHPFNTARAKDFRFKLPYLNFVWLLCDTPYPSFGKDETPVLLLCTVYTMLKPGEPGKLDMEQDESRTKVTIRFLDQFAS